jgi:hypothetical protein
MNKFFWFVIALVVCVVVGLLFYPNAEQKAQTAYDQAFIVEQSADLDRALVLYDELIFEYPETKAAVLAEKGKLRIFEIKEKSVKSQMRDQIARLRLALKGYQSMFGKMPASLSDLDDGEYFFDSDYLSEMIPLPYTTYLALSADEPPRIWPIHAKSDSVYASTDQEGALLRMSKADALQQINEGYTEVVKKGQMVFLQKK